MCRVKQPILLHCFGYTHEVKKEQEIEEKIMRKMWSSQRKVRKQMRQKRSVFVEVQLHSGIFRPDRAQDLCRCLQYVSEDSDLDCYTQTESVVSVMLS